MSPNAVSTLIVTALTGVIVSVLTVIATKIESSARKRAWFASLAALVAGMASGAVTPGTFDATSWGERIARGIMTIAASHLGWKTLVQPSIEAGGIMATIQRRTARGLI